MRDRENGLSLDYGAWLNQLGQILSDAGIEIPREDTEDIFGDIERGDTNGKAKPFDGRGGNCNAIPGYPNGACHPLLIVRCYNKDKLWARLTEMLYHAGIYCRGINKQVIFFTTKWDPAEVEFHRQAIRLLQHENVRFAFILISERGLSPIYL